MILIARVGTDHPVHYLLLCYERLEEYLYIFQDDVLNQNISIYIINKCVNVLRIDISQTFYTKFFVKFYIFALHP